MGIVGGICVCVSKGQYWGAGPAEGYSVLKPFFDSTNPSSILARERKHSPVQPANGMKNERTVLVGLAVYFRKKKRALERDKRTARDSRRQLEEDRGAIFLC